MEREGAVLGGGEDEDGIPLNISGLINCIQLLEPQSVVEAEAGDPIAHGSHLLLARRVQHRWRIAVGPAEEETCALDVLGVGCVELGGEGGAAGGAGDGEGVGISP